MAWIVQPLQRKDADGNPSGLWHLTAQSDEGGGFSVGCDHDHGSAEEAQDCKDAKIKLGQVTGFPYEETIIKINGDPVEWSKPSISHEEICGLAGEPVSATVTYHVKLSGDAERNGITYKGESIRVANGMYITCVRTGNA